MTSEGERKTRENGPVTLINVFEVPAGQVEEFITQWRVRAKVMAAAPGFRDARLHRAVSSQARFQLVNVAHWDSRADPDAAFGSAAFQDRIQALRQDPEMRFSGNPAVYEVVAELGGL
jgi:heme oxygenase (mycobilin-producing)